MKFQKEGFFQTKSIKKWEPYCGVEKNPKKLQSRKSESGTEMPTKNELQASGNCSEMRIFDYQYSSCRILK